MTYPVPSPQKYSFSKRERLCGKRAFDHFFKHSSAWKGGMFKLFFSYPFPAELVNSSVSFAFIVPKRMVSKATDRNRIKRVLREIIRLNKHLLIDRMQGKPQPLVVAIKWETKQPPVYKDTETAILKAFERVIAYIELRTPPPSF